MRRTCDCRPQSFLRLRTWITLHASVRHTSATPTRRIDACRGEQAAVGHLPRKASQVHVIARPLHTTVPSPRPAGILPLLALGLGPDLFELFCSCCKSF